MQNDMTLHTQYTKLKQILHTQYTNPNRYYTPSTQTQIDPALRVRKCSRVLCVKIKVKEIKTTFKMKGNVLNDRRKYRDVESRASWDSVNQM